jgi:hypothetical protein
MKAILASFFLTGLAYSAHATNLFESLLAPCPEKPLSPEHVAMVEKTRIAYDRDIKHDFSLWEKHKYSLHILMNADYVVYLCTLTVDTNLDDIIVAPAYTHPETNTAYHFALQIPDDPADKTVLSVTNGATSEQLVISPNYSLTWDGERKHIEAVWQLLSKTNSAFLITRKANQGVERTGVPQTVHPSAHP